MEQIIKAKRYTLITTILDGIYMFLSLLGMGITFLFFVTHKFFSTTSDILSNAPNHDLTGGYEIIGGMVFGFFEGIIAAIVIFGVIVFFVLLIITMISMISGIRSLNKAKMGMYTFKNDAILKLITHSIISVLILLIIGSGNIGQAIILAVPFLIVALLSYLVVNAMNEWNQKNAM